MLELLVAALFALVGLIAFLVERDAWLREVHNLRVLQHRLAAWDVYQRYRR